MTLNALIEDVAKRLALADSADLQALVEIQEALRGIAENTDAKDLVKLSEQSVRAAALIDSIIMRDIDDAEEALRSIQQSVEYAQKVVDAATRGDDPAGVPEPEGQATPNVDLELLEAWISAVRDSIGEIEALSVECESAGDPSPQIAEARRIIHTIKGECGVLALHEAQRLCHDLESFIDERLAGPGAAFPTDAALALVDWFRAYTEHLSENPTVTPPDAAPVEDALKNAPSAGASDESAPEPGGDPTTEQEGPSWGEMAPAPADASPEPAQEVPAPSDPNETPAAADEPTAEGGGEEVTFPSEVMGDENMQDFLCEAQEHITGAEAALLSLEHDPGELELINTVFRAFHTIKGVAGFLNLKPIVELAHQAETLLDKARTGQISLDTPLLDLILKSCDMMRGLIGILEGSSGPTTEQLSVLISRLVEAVETGSAPATSGPTPTAATAPDIADTGEAPAAVTDQKPDAGEAPVVAESTPSEAKPTPASVAQGSGQPEPARSDAAKGAKARTAAAQTVKVNMGRMDSLVDMVGELVIAQQMVVQDDRIEEIKNQKTRRNLTHVGKIIRDLQEVAMSLRMVTVKGTFQKMARLVRDVSAKAGKQIDFVMEGEDTELDRTVVDEIADPLVHMIRNSCDHGIEPSDERLAAGKPARGTLTLRAYHQGGSIVIEVCDDGRGLHREKLLEKAVERGVVSPEDAEKMPDHEVHNLIFAAGFSTAEKVTDISGRGVGMDVVRRNIEALRGKIEIRSAAGEGSTFRMRLPLTMAIIDGMVVRVGSQRYVIPTLSLVHSFRPTAEQLSTVAGGRGEMVNIRGELLPIYKLNRVFSVDEGVTDPSDALLIVLESNDARCALLVDEILDQQQVVIKSLGGGIEKPRGVSGGAILGDGRVALIVDVGGLINQATHAAA